MSCPFCKLERKTEWYLHDVVNDIIACEDLHKRGYKYRILVVGSSPRWHRKQEKYSQAEMWLLMDIARAIAYYHLKIGKADNFLGLDTERHKIKDHWHIQALMQ